MKHPTRVSGSLGGFTPWLSRSPHRPHANTGFSLPYLAQSAWGLQQVQRLVRKRLGPTGQVIGCWDRCSSEHTPRAEPRTGPQPRVRVAVARGQAKALGQGAGNALCDSQVCGKSSRTSRMDGSRPEPPSSPEICNSIKSVKYVRVFPPPNLPPPLRAHTHKQCSLWTSDIHTHAHTHTHTSLGLSLCLSLARGREWRSRPG